MFVNGKAAGAVLGALLSAAASPAASADDLRYRHAEADGPLLRNFDNEPYWTLLTRCAGLQGAMSRQAETLGMKRRATPLVARGGGFF